MTGARLGETPLADVPATPGVYLMLGADHELLYVGKATNLRTRLRSYARPAGEGRRFERVTELVGCVREVRWEEWPTGAAARERETTLLRALRPPYNDTHTDRAEYFFVTVSDAGRGRTRLAMSTAPAAGPAGGRAYGCFPFAAAVPTALAALARLLCLAAGRRQPANPARSTGCLVVLPEDVRPALHAYLSGRSPRLLGVLRARLAGVDEITARSVGRDLETARRFYADGPRELRRLRSRHRLPAGPVSPDGLHELVAAQLRADLGVDLWVRPRADVERRVWQLYAEGQGPARIVAALNADGVARFGGGSWSVGDVDRIVRGGGDRARRPEPS